VEGEEGRVGASGKEKTRSTAAAKEITVTTGRVGTTGTSIPYSGKRHLFKTLGLSTCYRWFR